MDCKVKAMEVTETYPLWDVKIENGCVPLIHDEEEDVQTATLACLLEKGTIPGLSQAGVPWTDFLTKEISFGEMDIYIRESLQNTGMETFSPDYQINDGTLVVGVKKED